jgi:hypothetical protein
MTTIVILLQNMYYVFELFQAHNARKAFLYYDDENKSYILLSMYDDYQDDYYMKSKKQRRILQGLNYLFSENHVIRCELFYYTVMPFDVTFDFLDNWERFYNKDSSGNRIYPARRFYNRDDRHFIDMLSLLRSHEFTEP